MNKEQFLDEYYLIKQQVDDLLDKSRALEKEYLKANSPIPASVENPVLVEVDIEQTHIDRNEKTKDIRRIHDEKYLVGYVLNKPFSMTQTTYEKEKYIDKCFVYPVFRNVKKDGTVSKFVDKNLNHYVPWAVDNETITFWEKGKDEKYFFDYKNNIVKL